MENVNLSDIKIPSKSELNSSRLYALENSYDSFETKLNSGSDPIALDKSSRKPI
jgi:hypothetical protein